MTETPWKDWLGRSRETVDTIVVDRAVALHATLDLDGPEPQADDPLPPLWHWMYFWEPAPARDLGRDGHPALGGFLPPLPLDRRMWAGSRITFQRPIPLGTVLERRSTIQAIREKAGRTGSLAFVTVRHDFRLDGDIALVDEHDIVYREPARPGEKKPEPVPLDLPPDRIVHRQRLSPDTVTLFRYSALTLNGHRIHYDHPYATGVEGYAGLVVHGPLLATYMAAAAAREGRLASFAFRGRRPVTCGETFDVVVPADPEVPGGRQMRVVDGEGFVVSAAEAVLAKA